MDEEIRVAHDGEAEVYLVMGSNVIEMTRYEAECLFVDLGYVLKDMDAINAENGIEVE